MRIFTLLLSFFIATGAWAQGSVTGSVLDNTGKPVEKASVIILNVKDSSEVKGTSTGSDGVYHLRHINPGQYLVVASAVGMVKRYSDPFTVGSQETTVPGLRLDPEVKALSEVTITNKKPMIEQKIDRVVVNVDASPTNVGTTVMDVLQKTPGVSVDKDGNISLKGKSGVMVMMDGKPTYLSAADLANLLKNMPSSELEQIELMTNPPAKYDAAGNAGIINLKTKKNKARGFNGNVTIGGGIGKGPKANNSLNLNYRSGKFNFFASYNESYNRHPQTLDLVRKFRDTIGGPVVSVFNQHSDMMNDFSEQSFKVGTDYSLDKKTTIGVVLTGYFNPGYFDNTSKTNIEDGQGNIDSVMTTFGHTKMYWHNFGTNLNFKHTFDTAGTELSADFDYLGYGSSSYQMYQTEYATPDGTLLPPVDTLRGITPGNIYIYTGKVDFVHPFKNNWKLEAGIKGSSVRTDNDAEYDNLTAGKWIVDTTKTNHFVYTEMIGAAYGNVTKVFNKKWTVQAGLRLETTNSKGDLKTNNTTFNRNYTQLFPTTYIQYTLNDKNQFVLDYGRRIQRPDYGDLNPFKYFLDPYTYQEGNPYLKPQFSNTVELSHTYHSFLTTTLNYTQVTDIIQQVLLQNDATHTTFVQQGNVARQENIGLSVNAGLPVTKWWTPNLYVSGQYNDFKGIVNGYPLEVFGYSVTGNMNNSFTFKHGWSAEVSGWYQGRQVSGTLIANPMGQINFGAGKQVFKNAGTIRLNLQDPFNLGHFSGYSRYGNVDVTIVNHWDNRVVNLSFTYRFGKNQQNIKEHRQSSSASEEESRVKKGN
ncbi:TonB-dependent receptor [Dinghuibacter silviterrae]|uniref:Outer membrane receptor protein involved in Fe transport n=1 Tax=Dinghuibacter silviterrae TaxID=1539049 RepID=A0A4R8DXH4_9BACT|nr:TonB-dependent receptor [Dinghuibacter silviterrae]TDX02245.1 outer membrane receptor protein involved in Fe transport [Dinghuibacter silviterrae]